MKFSSDTQKRVELFKEKFMMLGYNDGHYVLACHAAFPIAITPNLLYQIWANFKNYQGYLTSNSPRSIDIIAVSDLLMSNLFVSTSKNFFEMDQKVRGFLLESLVTDNRFGEDRIKALARFLYQYTDLTHSDSAIEDAQYWTALATLDSEKAAGKIKAALAESIETKNETEILRLRELLEAYSYQDGRFTGLLEYSKGIKAAIFGYRDSVIEKQFDKANMLAVSEEIQDGDRVLEIPLWQGLESRIKIYTSEEEKQAWQEALSRIQKVKEKNATQLDLSKLGLKKIPEEVFELTQLEELDLYDNRLVKFPSSIAKLKSLKKLLASKNPIKNIPSFVTLNLKKLEVLKLDNAKVEVIPNSIFQHKNLRDLSLENNQIRFLSPRVATMKNLKLLDLRGNPVLNIPTNYLKATFQKIKNYFEGLPKFEKDIPVMLVLLSSKEQLNLREETNVIKEIFEGKGLHLEIINNPTTVELFKTFKKYEKQLTLCHIGGGSVIPGEPFVNAESIRLSEIYPKDFLNLIGDPINLKLFVTNRFEIKEDKLSRKAQGIITITDRVTIENSTRFFKYFYGGLAKGKTLSESFEETKNKMSFLKLNFEWEIFPSEISDLSPIQNELKSWISKFDVNQFLKYWNTVFSSDYKKETIRELRKQYKAYSSREHSNTNIDQDSFSKISSGLIRLVDEVTIEHTKAFQIRNWKLFRGIDFVKFLDTPLLQLPVDVLGDDLLKKRFIKSYQESPSKFLEIKEGITSDYELRIKNNELSIYSKNQNSRLIHGVNEFSNSNVKYIVKCLEQIEKWERVSHLENQNSRLDVAKIDVRILDVEKNEYHNSNSIELELKGKFVPIEIQINNSGLNDLFATSLGIESNFRISAYYKNFPLFPNTPEWINLNSGREFGLWIDEKEDLSEDIVLKIIFSTNEIDTNLFEETEIVPSIVEKYERKEIGTRSISYGFKESIVEDWFVQTLNVKVVRTEDAAWDLVIAANTEAKYLEYLELFPKGKYQNEVSNKLIEIRNENIKDIEEETSNLNENSSSYVEDRSITKKNIEDEEDVYGIERKERDSTSASLDSKSQKVNNLSELKVLLKNALIKDIGNSLELLMRYTDEKSTHYNHIIISMGSFNSMKKDIIQGTISDGNAQMRHARLRNSIMYIIDNLEEEDIKSFK